MISDNEAISIAILQIEVKQLASDVEALTKATEGLLDAWNGAGTVLKLMKWLSTLATAVTAIWAARHLLVRAA